MMSDAISGGALPLQQRLVARLFSVETSLDPSTFVRFLVLPSGEVADFRNTRAALFGLKFTR
jgi:hypothetical protein